jgi:AcrR family transcriptional regulator
MSVPVDVLREAVRERVAATSLRAVEAATGVSYTSLRWFLTGSDPYSSTLTKLASWYFREVAGSNTAEAMSTLLAALPTKTRSEAESSIRAAVMRAFEQAGCPVPNWLTAQANMETEKTVISES